MAAENTDLLKKLARRWVGQIGAGGVTDGAVTTIPLASSTNLPTDTAVVATINRVDSSGAYTPSAEETVIGVVSGSNLTSCVRGVEGTAQAHSAGAVVEILVTARGWNDLVDHLLTQHDQLGKHTNITACNITASGVTTASHVTASDVTSRIVTASDMNVSHPTGNILAAGADPWRTITLVPGALKPTTTSGCGAAETVEAGSNDVDYAVLPFDASSDERAFVNFEMPDSWDGGVIQFRFIWTNAGGGSAETVEFELKGRSYADDDAIDQAGGTAVALSDTWIAQGDIHRSAWSGDVTLAGGPAAGELVHLEIMRDVSDDNLTGDARLIALQIRFRQSQYSD